MAESVKQLGLALFLSILHLNRADAQFTLCTDHLSKIPTQDRPVQDRLILAERRLLPSPDATFTKMVTGLRRHPELPSLLVFDFPMLSLANQNIVNAERSAKIGGRDYASLSVVEKSDLIFNPYLNQWLSQTGPVPTFHFDHHYAYPVLAHTSTTVLVADWIDWLAQEIDHGGDRAIKAKRAFSALTGGVSVLDHSDADILLSQMLARHAMDYMWIEQNARRLSDVSLYLEYGQLPQGSKRYRSEIGLISLVLESLQTEIEHHQTDVVEAMSAIQDALDLVDFFRTREPYAGLDLLLLRTVLNPLILPDRFQKNWIRARAP